MHIVFQQKNKRESKNEEINSWNFSPCRCRKNHSFADVFKLLELGSLIVTGLRDFFILFLCLVFIANVGEICYN